MTDTNHSNPDDPTRGRVVSPQPPKIETQEGTRERQMADDHAPRHWIETVERIVDKVLKFAAPFAIAYLAWIGNKNSNQIQQVETRQVEVKDDLAVKAKEDAKATRVQLWNAWKQLEWIAEESGKPKDKEKAADAKRVYDEWQRLNGNGN